MTKNLKWSIVLFSAFALVAAITLVLSRGGDAPAADDAADDTVERSGIAVVREDSHRLREAPAGAPVFVEFLDFECEACGAIYPAIEQLREEYDGQVTFVARHFPIPSHFNAERAAVAVEAAAQQGAFEEMYHLVFQTQAAWGKQQVPKDDLFRGLAENIGLDMAAYDEAVADPATLERVTSDRDDGLALGVQGTPTFFLDGEKLDIGSFEELRASLDAAIED